MSYRVVAVQLHMLLTSVLDAGEWSASSHSETAPTTHGVCVAAWDREHVWRLVEKTLMRFQGTQPVVSYQVWSISVK
jgi:hypothetical protein